MLSQAERDAGWRLSCQCAADDLTLEFEPTAVYWLDAREIERPVACSKPWNTRNESRAIEASSRSL